MSYMNYWGKSDPTSLAWRPVAGHTAAATLAAREIMGLWSLYLRRLGERAGWTPQETRNAILYATAIHDIGKFHVAFQWKNEDLYKQTYDDSSGWYEAKNISYDPGYYHGTTGLLWYCDGTGQNIFDNTPLLAASAHHGQFPSEEDQNQIGKLKRKLRQHLKEETKQDLQAMLEYEAEIRALFPPPAPPTRETGETEKSYWFRRNNVATLIAFIVSVSDWIGSNDFFFPLKEQWGDRSFTYFYHDPATIARAKEAVEDTGLARQWEVFNTEIKALQGKEMTEVQKYAQTLHHPKLTIIEAPTGDGKTEAALVVALHLLLEGLVDRMVFALPTKATANAMFKRLNGQMRASTLIGAHLQHGSAYDVLVALQETEEIKAEQRVDEKRKETLSTGEEDSAYTRIRWLSSNKKGLLNTFVSCTIDQILMSSLKNNRHAFVKAGALATSVIIIDEVHATDLYQGGILARALETWSGLGTHVVLLSATLSPRQRDQLVASFRKGLGLKHTPILTSTHYPLVTTLNAQGEVNQQECASRRTPRTMKVKVVTHGWENKGHHSDVGKEDIEWLAADLAISVDKGACTCCIVNTVGTSQELYAEVRKQRPDIEVVLLNASLYSAHRLEVEEFLSQRFGPPWQENVDRKPSLVIGTQILEQSLDLDFDRMIRQLCPMDGLIQALGRCHRHQRDVRPVGYGEPVLEVWAPSYDERFPEGTIYSLIYSEVLCPLRRTWRMLEHRTQVVEPDDVPSLIAEVFTEDEPTSTELKPLWEKDAGHGKKMLGTTLNVTTVMDEETIKDTDTNLYKVPTRLGVSSRPFMFLVKLEDGVYRVAHTDVVIDMVPFRGVGLEPCTTGNDYERRNYRRKQKELLRGDALGGLWNTIRQSAQRYSASRSKITVQDHVVTGCRNDDMRLLEELWEVSGSYPRRLCAIPLSEDTAYARVVRVNMEGGVAEFEAWYDRVSGLHLDRSY